MSVSIIKISNFTNKNCEDVCFFSLIKKYLHNTFYFASWPAEPTIFAI